MAVKEVFSGVLKWALVRCPSPYYPKVAEIFRRYRAPLYGDQTTSISKIFKKDSDRFCKALLHGAEIKGLLVYKTDPQHDFKGFNISNSLEVKTLLVLEDNGNLTAESAILQEMTNVAKRRRVAHVTVSVSEQDSLSQTIVEKYGFKVFQTKEGLYKSGIKEYFYCSSLETLITRIQSAVEIPESSQRKKRARDDEREGMEKRTRFQEEQERKYPPRVLPARFCDTKEKNAEITRQSVSRPSPNDFHLGGGRHQLTLRKIYIDQIRRGEKTVEVRIFSGPIWKYQRGNTLRFFYQQNPLDDVVCDILDVQKFSSFLDLLRAVGASKCLPGVKTLDEAVEIYNKIPGYVERANRNGVAAIFLRVNEQKKREYHAVRR